MSQEWVEIEEDGRESNAKRGERRQQTTENGTGLARVSHLTRENWGGPSPAPLETVVCETRKEEVRRVRKERAKTTSLFLYG